MHVKIGLYLQVFSKMDEAEPQDRAVGPPFGILNSIVLIIFDAKSYARQIK